jgi:SAM-dependent methyltransferase/predicted  nucleic acid-binding Zn-ribbon protein
MPSPIEQENVRMSERRYVDVEEIMERIRDSLRHGRAPSDGGEAESSDDSTQHSQATADLDFLTSGYDVRQVALVSHRRVFGQVVIGLKRAIRQLLTPILDRQVACNAAVVRVIADTRDWIAALERRRDEATEAIEARINRLARKLDGHDVQITSVEVAVSRFNPEVARVDARVAGVQAQVDGIAVQVQGMTLRLDVMESRLAVVDTQIAILAEGIRARDDRLTAVEEASVRTREDILRQDAALAEATAGQERQLREATADQERQLREATADQERQLREAMDVARADADRQFGAARDDLDRRLGAYSRSMDAAQERGRALRERVSAAERRLRRLRTAGAEGTAPGVRVSPLPLSERVDHDRSAMAVEFDYAGFEERFRGSEEEVREHQRAYLDCFRDRQPVIDLGCGRGEFLQLMREAGLSARGVDVDTDMVLLCREKGFDVTAADAEAFLAALPDDSVGGIFAAQIIEHLAPERVIGLVQLCQRKLSPGGVLVMETPNPTCLTVFADSFYKDPSHIRPLHPDMMQFLFETTGFEDVELRFSAPVSAGAWVPPLDAPAANRELFNEGLERLNRLLYGFQDYAIIGRAAKPARA